MQGLAGERDNFGKTPPTSPEYTVARIGRPHAHTLYNWQPSLPLLRMRSAQPGAAVARAGRAPDNPKGVGRHLVRGLCTQALRLAVWV